MKVLIACEESQRVCEALREEGYLNNQKGGKQKDD